MWDWGMEQPLRGRSGPAGEEGLSHSPDLPQPRRPQECSPEVQPSLLLGCSRGSCPGHAGGRQPGSTLLSVTRSPSPMAQRLARHPALAITLLATAELSHHQTRGTALDTWAAQGRTLPRRPLEHCRDLNPAPPSVALIISNLILSMKTIPKDQARCHFCIAGRLPYKPKQKHRWGLGFRA